MSALRCTQKLRTAMTLKPASHAAAACTASTAPGLAAAPSSPALLGDWSMNLVFTRMRPAKLVLAVSEHDRISLLLEALPFATLPQRFTEALFAHLLTLHIAPEIARRECDAMQPLVITATTRHENRRSIQRDMTDYTLLVQEQLIDGDRTLAQLNAHLARQLSSATGMRDPEQLLQSRLCGSASQPARRDK